MAFRVRTEIRFTTTGLDNTIYILEEELGRARAEIWPANGCNCFRWQVVADETRLELLYADPKFFEGAKPTRSGIPILFPFPNRIRDGRFTWMGQPFQLPLNDSAGKNAIHGFACRHPWRVLEQREDRMAAWLTAEFHGSIDAPESRHLWPADYLIRLTFRLEMDALTITAVVENPDRVSLPFGLGFHPYFKLPAVDGEQRFEYRALATPGQLWEAGEGLPTGRLVPVDAARDLRRPRPVADLELDDVWHSPEPPGAAGEKTALLYRASVLRPGNGPEVVRLETSPFFRALVGFTPPHREAICFEPYTCATDAINLQERGVDAGLLVLAPGEQWRGQIRLVL
jgi:aldose 1-epimerase